LRPVRDHSRILEFGQNLVRKRDFYAGTLMILFGLVMALKGPGYRTGTLMHMGPGFLPTALGVLLVLLGIAIVVPAAMLPKGEDEEILPKEREWWGWACILAGPLCFIFFGNYGGLVPGTFACVFVSALGDRTATYKGAFLLATVVTIFGVTLFHFLLQVPMPVLEWRGL
jgi:hypothetical protein